MKKPNIEEMAKQLDTVENIRLYKNFTQWWGNTGTGFTEPGCFYGQAMTETDVTILENGKQLFVFLDNELCYTADKTPEIETDIAKGFIEGRTRAKKKYNNVTWKEKK